MEPCSSLVAPMAAVCRASAPTYRGKLGRMVRRTRTAHCWRRAGAQCCIVPKLSRVSGLGLRRAYRTVPSGRLGLSPGSSRL